MQAQQAQQHLTVKLLRGWLQQARAAQQQRHVLAAIELYMQHPRMQASMQWHVPTANSFHIRNMVRSAQSQACRRMLSRWRRHCVVQAALKQEDAEAHWKHSIMKRYCPCSTAMCGCLV